MTLWTPANLATPSKLWLKANDLGLSNGATVTSWTDSSGAGAHATVPSWGTAPTFQTNQLNSLAIVRLTAAPLQALSATPTADVPYTAVGLARDFSGTNGRIFSNRNATGWLMGWWGGFEEALNANGWVNGPGGLPGGTLNWNMYGATGDGAAGTLYKNGSLVVSNAGGLGGPGNSIGLSGSDSLGTTDMTNAEVAEFVLCNYVMSTSDRQKTEGYMAWKWGQQASLPGGHPFAGAAPTLGSAGSLMLLGVGGA